MKHQIDVAAGSGGRVLRAAAKIKRLHAKLLRIKLRGDTLCNAVVPAPVFFFSTSGGDKVCFHLLRFFLRRREKCNRLIEFDVHQYAQNLTIVLTRHTDDA